MFKASHIPIWCDAPDGCLQYDVDVIVQDLQIVDEADLPRWRAFVERQHTLGKLVCAELRPLTHTDRMLEYTMSDPGMQEAVCRDLELQPIPISWMKEHSYHGKVPCFYCSNHPRYQEFLRQQMRFFVHAGVDGVMVDDAGGAFFAYSRGGCFCDYCMAGFREYLRAKYSTDQLRAGGIENPESFDYRTFVLQRARDRQTYAAERQRIRWTKDFQDFLVRSDVSLFASLHEMARRLSGKHIPFGWDNVDFAGSRAPYYPLLDAFYSEINYQNFADQGRGPDEVLPPGIIMLNKLADALGKWYTPTPAPRSWQSIRDRNLTGLLRQWIAFTYANGGAMRYPRKGWIFSETDPWYYPPQQEFEPLYALVRSHRELFDDYEPVEQVGVLFTQDAGGGGGAYYGPLKHVCAELVESNVPFGFVVAGDEQLANRLKGDEAGRFEVMLIPEPIRLIDGQQAIVDRWKQEGKAVSVRSDELITDKLQYRVESVVSVESGSRVWLFPRYVPNRPATPIVCHLINPQYDAGSNKHVPQENVRIRLAGSLFHGTRPRQVTYYTVGQPPSVLPFEHDADGVRVTVPRVELWGIVRIELGGSVGG